MKAILLPLAACAALAGCVGYGGVGYADPYYNGGYGYTQPGYAQPGYYGAQPNVYIGGTYYDNDGRDHRHRDARGGPRGDRDRDGVPNRYDRDRDGDGVRDRNDSRPNNPRRN